MGLENENENEDVTAEERAALEAAGKIPKKKEEEEDDNNPLSALGLLVGDEDDDSGNDDDEYESDPEKRAAAEKEQATAFGKQIREKIDGFALPADFDFSQLTSGDPGEQRKALESIQRKSIESTIGLFLPILNSALKENTAAVMRDMKEQMKNQSSKQSTDSLLSESIREYKDPALKPVIKRLYTALSKQQGVTEADKIKGIKSKLKALGITMEDPDEDEVPKKKKKDNALDDFFPGIG